MTEPAKEDVAGRKEPSRQSTPGQRITAINNLEDAIASLDERVAQLTAAVEYAAVRMHDVPEPVAEDDTEDVDQLASEAAKAMTSNCLDLSKLEIYEEDGDVVIDRKRDHEQSDEFREWTEGRFGEGKPGYISWGTYERDDSDDVGYYPKAFRLPTEKFEEVFG